MLGLGWEICPLSIVFFEKICEDEEKGLVVSLTVLLETSSSP